MPVVGFSYDSQNHTLFELSKQRWHHVPKVTRLVSGGAWQGCQISQLKMQDTESVWILDTQWQCWSKDVSATLKCSSCMSWGRGEGLHLAEWGLRCISEQVCLTPSREQLHSLAATGAQWPLGSFSLAWEVTDLTYFQQLYGLGELLQTEHREDLLGQIPSQKHCEPDTFVWTVCDDLSTEFVSEPLTPLVQNRPLSPSSFLGLDAEKTKSSFICKRQGGPSIDKAVRIFINHHARH